MFLFELILLLFFMQKDVEACNRGKMKGKEKKENKEAKTS